MNTEYLVTRHSKLPLIYDNTDVAVIVGCGKTAFTDLSKFKNEFRGLNYTIWAVNDAGFYILDNVSHLFCVETYMFDLVKSLRQYRKLNTDFITHSLAEHTGDITWKTNKRTPRNSGMLAIVAALNNGHKRVVLCGVPMDSSGHFYDDSAEVTTDQYEYLLLKSPFIRTSIDTYRSSIRSMSGLTQDKYGYPTMDWLLGNT